MFLNIFKKLNEYHITISEMYDSGFVSQTTVPVNSINQQVFSCIREFTYFFVLSGVKLLKETNNGHLISINVSLIPKSFLRSIRELTQTCSFVKSTTNRQNKLK